MTDARRDAAPGAVPAGDPPLVSVMLITYNQEQFVVEAIESILSQDYPSFELIVADDGSRDGTPAIIADYARRYPDRVVPVLNPVNRGITANCNSGLARVRGKYFTHVGGDDMLLPGKLAAQVAWLEADPDRVLCGHQVEVFYDDDSVPPHPLSATLPHGRGPAHLLRHAGFGALSVMVRTDALPAHGFEPSLPMVSDYMLWAEVLAAGGTFGAVDRTLARYRQHSTNVTLRRMETLVEVEKYYAVFAERHPRYAADCAYGYTRHVLYDSAVFLIGDGQPRAAIGYLLKAVRRSPLFVKAWLRLGQAGLKTLRG